MLAKLGLFYSIGLEEVLLLQKGSFSVKLVLKGTTSLPGIKTEDGLEGINQKATVTPGRYIIGGTEVQFGQLKNSGRLSIVIPDKLKQNFWVTVSSILFVLCNLYTYIKLHFFCKLEYFEFIVACLSW